MDVSFISTADPDPAWSLLFLLADNHGCPQPRVPLAAFSRLCKGSGNGGLATPHVSESKESPLARRELGLGRCPVGLLLWPCCRRKLDTGHQLAQAEATSSRSGHQDGRCRERSSPGATAACACPAPGRVFCRGGFGPGVSKGSGATRHASLGQLRLHCPESQRPDPNPPSTFIPGPAP